MRPQSGVELHCCIDALHTRTLIMRATNLNFLAGKDAKVEDVLRNAIAHDAFVVVVASDGAPSRRACLCPGGINKQSL